MTDETPEVGKPEEEGYAAARADGPRPLPQMTRPKMSLDEQATFLSAILRRCTMHGPELRGHFAGEATLTLTTDDMLRLETIQQTLAIFDTHNAGQLVKDAIGRKMRGRRQ